MIISGCDYLPSAISWSLFNRDWTLYKEAIYRVFSRDFIEQRPLFSGKPVDIIHEKFFEGKERSFWHIISAGDYDTNREPNEDRCARLPWIKPLIEEAGACSDYALWSKWHDATKRDRYYIWCRKNNYLVVLEDRGSHFKLITAFYVEYGISKYEKEYSRYLKTKTPT